jgi:hypothetical protein
VSPPALTLALLRLTQYAAADAVLAATSSADVDLLNTSSTDLVLTP